MYLWFMHSYTSIYNKWMFSIDRVKKIYFYYVHSLHIMRKVTLKKILILIIDQWGVFIHVKLYHPLFTFDNYWESICLRLKLLVLFVYCSIFIEKKNDVQVHIIAQVYYKTRIPFNLFFICEKFTLLILNLLLVFFGRF